MKLGEVREEDLCNGRWRLSGEAIYDGLPDGVQSEWFHFDFPKEMRGRLTRSGNPWLVLFLPISMALGESLEISRPVDSLLLEGCRELLEIWCTWFPDFHMIDLKASGGYVETGVGEGRTGMFFSSGIDSSYTLLRHQDRPNDPRAEKISDLVTVFGIYSREAAVMANQKGGAVRARMDRLASQFGKRRVEICTNIYLTKFMMTNSLRHSYGCALTASVLIFDGVFDRFLIPGSFTYRYSGCAGSHPYADKLYSTGATKFIPDGCGLEREEKLDYLVDNGHDLSSLQVCSRDSDLHNCGVCAKCARTMLMLTTMGRLNQCELFREKVMDVNKVSNIYCSTNSLRRCVERAAGVTSSGLEAIAEAAKQALLGSAWIDHCRSLLGRLRRGEPLWPHDQPLLAQMLGLTDSPGCSPAVRAALSAFLTDQMDLFRCLQGLALGTSGERPAERELHLLEHALVRAVICESTLDLQRQHPGVELCLPGARYDSAEWLYRLGLINGTPLRPAPVP